jgi:hypothetical protein
VTVNGTTFTTSRVVGIDSMGTLDITAFVNNGKDSGVVDLNFPDSIKIQSYNEDTSNYMFAYNGTNTKAGYNGPTYSVIYDANNDMNWNIPVITITTWNRSASTISGTFSGTTFLFNGFGYSNPTDSAVVRGGKFTCTYVHH